MTLFVFLAAIPAFRFGFWIHGTPTISLFLALAALAAALLAPLLRLRRSSKLPFASVFAVALGCWALIASAFSNAPFLSVMGSAPFGDGAAGWFALALMTISFRLVMTRRLGRRVLIAAALLALAVEACLYVATAVGVDASPNHIHQLFFWSLFASSVAIWCLADKSTFGWITRAAAALACAAYVAIHIALGIDGAVTATFIVVATILAATFARAVPFAMRPAGILAITICAFAPLFAVFHPESVHWEWLSTIQQGGSVAHRAEFLHDVALDIVADWRAIFVGRGWGTIEDALHRQLLAAPWSSFFSGGLWSPNFYDGARWFTVHTHNIFVEPLHGGGVFAPALLGLVLAAPLLVSRPSAPFVAWPLAAFALLGSFWYLTPANLPAFAFAIAALDRRARARPFHCPRPVAIAGLAIALITIVVAGVYGSTRSIALEDLASDLVAFRPVSARIEQFAQSDAEGAYVGVALYIAVTAARTVERRDADAYRHAWDNAAALWRDVRRRINQPGGTLDRLRFGELVLRGHLLVDDPPDTGSPPADVAAWVREGWFDAAFSATNAALHRGDILVAPLADGFAQGGIEGVARSARRLLERWPDDPAGLWFLGLAEIQSEQSVKQGFQRMARAIDLGLGRYYPVTPALERDVRRFAE